MTFVSFTSATATEGFLTFEFLLLTFDPLLHMNPTVHQILHSHPAFSNKNFELVNVGGGSINETYRIKLSDKELFCKINSAVEFPQLFEMERKGLELIRSQSGIKTPEVLDVFESGKNQVLLMEWIREGERNQDFWNKFGEQLAALHQVKAASFVLDEYNYMGSVPQSNQQSANWIDFFISQRLQPLVSKSLDKKLLGSRHLTAFENLYKKLPDIFDGDEVPVLVHGDLWSGNFICDEHHEPVLIDPALYYGIAAVDLGMTTLFGGFRKEFYEAYAYHAPFPPNYEEQWRIAKLYPLLIHLVLFGKSYLGEIEEILSS
jgi:fructosamine-3-kinase